MYDASAITRKIILKNKYLLDKIKMLIIILLNYLQQKGFLKTRDAEKVCGTKNKKTK